MKYSDQCTRATSVLIRKRIFHGERGVETNKSHAGLLLFLGHLPLKTEVFLGVTERLLVLIVRFSLAAGRARRVSLTLIELIESFHFFRVHLNDMGDDEKQRE